MEFVSDFPFFSVRKYANLYGIEGVIFLATCNTLHLLCNTSMLIKQYLELLHT